VPQTALVTFLGGLRVGDSIGVVVPHFQGSVDVSDAIFVAKRPDVKEGDVG
jgi:hypothetical protein